MNIDASLFNKDKESRLTVTHSKKSEPLRQCVSDAMQRYFQNLNGHGANNLYRLVMNEVEAPLLESVMKHTGRGKQQAQPDDWVSLIQGRGHDHRFADEPAEQRKGRD